MGEHFTDFASFTIPPSVWWFGLCWLAALSLVIGLSATRNRQPDPQEDREQAAYLQAWKAAQHARARKDTRGQKEAMDGLQRALHAKLRSEVR